MAANEVRSTETVALRAKFTGLSQMIGRPSHPGAVLELPLGIRDGFGEYGVLDSRVQDHQTLHEKPLVGGFVSRMPARPLAIAAFTTIRAERLPLAASGAATNRHSRFTSFHVNGRSTCAVIDGQTPCNRGTGAHRQRNTGPEPGSSRALPSPSWRRRSGRRPPGRNRPHRVPVPAG